MREIIARFVCALAASVVVALAVLFAWRHNPRLPGGADSETSLSSTNPRITENAERGRQLYADQHCATCHSLAGVGNPRYPLDKVGARSSPGEVRDWITATGEAGQKLPGAVASRKSKYRELTDEELDALTAYVLASRGKP